MTVACAALRCAGAERRYKVEPGVVAALYDAIIMPLTKEVQVAYLLRRLDAA
jgi:chorismate mutase